MTSLSAPTLYTREQRRRAVAWALRLTQHTSLAPSHYERKLLSRFVSGALTIDEVLEQLETHTASVV